MNPLMSFTYLGNSVFQIKIFKWFYTNKWISTLP